jgi:uncharacterized protein (DUF58 family)
MFTEVSNNLLTSQELALMGKLRFAPRRSFSGRMRGERISRQKGVSIEFADYRDYSDGDDLRHLDWTILARLDRPTMRTYQDEDDLAVYVALDASLSMDFGEPVKFAHAVKLATALGYIGLIGQDAITPVILGKTSPARTRSLRGRGSYRRLVDAFAGQQPDGNQGLATSLMRFAASRFFRPGLVVCITDGLDQDIEGALRAVAARGHELAVIQVLSDIELDPDLEGDLRLLDSENGDMVEITAHAQTLREYKRNLETHCALLESTTVRSGGRFVRSIAGQSISEFVTRTLTHAGLVH